MALGTITVTSDQRKQASAPLGCALLSFLGDSTYTAGGTLTFQALVRTAMAKDVTVLAVVLAGASGYAYTPVYDVATDTLVLKEGTAGADAQVANGDYSGTTFVVLVLYM